VVCSCEHDNELSGSDCTELVSKLIVSLHSLVKVSKKK
jgi:hypothetical protein